MVLPDLFLKCSNYIIFKANYPKYPWSPDPQSRPIEFYKPNSLRKDWATIEAPSTIERQVFGVPLYANYVYPFKVNPPFVMDEPDPKYTTFLQRNPVGSYLEDQDYWCLSGVFRDVFIRAVPQTTL